MNEELQKTLKTLRLWGLLAHWLVTQPAADHGASPAHTAPAVDVGGRSCGRRFADGVQDRSHRGTRRRGQVADGVATAAARPFHCVEGAFLRGCRVDGPP